MSEIQVSYDFYDDMCFALSELGNGNVKVPPWEVIRKLEQQEISLTLGTLAFFCENADAENEDEKKRLSYINRIIKDRVEFFEGVEPNFETGVVPEDSYLTLESISQNGSDFLSDGLPDAEEVSKCIGSYIRYCFSLAFFLYEQAKEKNKMIAGLLKKLMTENFRFEWADKPVELSTADFEKLKKELSGSRFGTEKWLPSPDDIRNYLAPNFSICYDYILWLLESVHDPESKQDQESLRMLRRLFYKNVRFLDKNGGRLETIWS